LEIIQSFTLESKTATATEVLAFNAGVEQAFKKRGGLVLILEIKPLLIDKVLLFLA